MSIIGFFGKVIKPVKLRGAGILNPAPTGLVDGQVACIRQLDVNLWLYRKAGQAIAIDAGHENFPRMAAAFASIGIHPDEVSAVFLTHADLDHAGGLSDGAPDIYPRACVYLHEDEAGLWTGKIKRMVLGPLAFKNSIFRSGGFKTLRDGDILRIGDIEVELIHIPGHTPGHSCYLVDGQVLFTGDCLAINQAGGYCFFKLFNMDTGRNLASLQRLKARFEKQPPRMICTGHSGYTTDQARYFRYIDQVAKGSKRRPFDPDAPRDVFA